MSSITIRGCCIGAGRPKVILPIVASTADGILSEAVRLAAQKADCIEWRADWFPGALDPSALGQVLSGLRAALEEKLLLVTFRTKAEGGEAALTLQQYASFCEAVCASGCADLLDIEFFRTGSVCRPSSNRHTGQAQRWSVPATISTKRRPGQRWSPA